MPDIPKTPTPRAVAGRLLGKLLMPLAATAVSAAAGYAAKNSAELLGRKLEPALRHARDAARKPVAAVADAAEAVVGGDDRADRDGAEATGADAADAANEADANDADANDLDANGATANGSRGLSQAQRARRRQERAARRDARRRNGSRT